MTTTQATPSVPRRVARVVTLGLALAPCACSSQSPRDWPDHEQEASAHFRYWTRSDDAQACPDITSSLEQQRSLVLDYLSGVQSDATIDYYKFRDSADQAAHAGCPTSRSDLVVSCQSDSRVWAYELMQQHELIHAHMWNRGRSAAFLEEGLAEALSCGMTARVPAGTSLPDLIAWSSSDPPALYADASLLVGYLLKLGGPEAFLQLYASLPHGASTDQVGAAFQQLYSASGAELYAAALAEPSDPGCVRLWECAGPDWDASSPSYDYASACGLPSFTPFNVSGPSLFVGAATQLTPCSAGAVAPASPMPLLNPVAAVLDTGRYFIGNFGDSLRKPEPTPLPAALYPLAEVVGSEASCAALRSFDTHSSSVLSFLPRTLAQGQPGPFFVHWNDSAIELRRAFDQGQGQRIAVSADCSEGLQVFACEGCAGVNACLPLCGASAETGGVPTLPADLVLEIAIADPTSEEIARVSLTLSDLPL